MSRYKTRQSRRSKNDPCLLLHQRNDDKSSDRNIAQVINCVRALNITYRQQWDCRTTSSPKTKTVLCVFLDNQVEWWVKFNHAIQHNDINKLYVMKIKS